MDLRQYYPIADAAKVADVEVGRLLYAGANRNLPIYVMTHTWDKTEWQTLPRNIPIEEFLYGKPYELLAKHRLHA